MSNKPPGRPCEAWISHDASHEQVGYVMGYLCQDCSARCFWSGECSYDGDCFHTDRSAAHKAAEAIRKAAEDESPIVRDIMRYAAVEILQELRCAK